MKSAARRLRGSVVHGAQQPAASPTKAGWRVREWSNDVGCSQSTTWELIAARRIESVKLGASRIILTPRVVFLASLRDSIDRDEGDARPAPQRDDDLEREGFATAASTDPRDDPGGMADRQQGPPARRRAPLLTGTDVRRRQRP